MCALDVRVLQVFVLAVQLKFPSIEKRNLYMELWRPLGQYCKHHEPATLSFELSVADSDPLTLLVFERYISKDDFTNVHRKSQAYNNYKKEFTRYLQDKVNVTGQSYYESNLGFM